MSRPPDRITNRPSRDEFADRLPKRRRVVEDDEDYPRDPSDRRFIREEWPLWVQLGLWGLPNRASAWAFVWISIACAVGSIAYGFLHPLFFLGGFMVLSALCYYAAIRWVDRHGRWK